MPGPPPASPPAPAALPPPSAPAPVASARPSKPPGPPSALTAEESVRAALTSTARAEIARSPVAALLPRDIELASAAVVTTGAKWYAASIRHGDRTISIHATVGAAHDPPPDVRPPPRRHRVRGFLASVTQNEGIQSVAWEEGGVSYVVEVECFQPFEDERCKNDDYVRGLAESLVRVGADR